MEPETPTRPTPLPKRWHIAIPIPAHIDQELAEFSPILRQLLFNRGIETAPVARAYVEARSPFPNDPFYLLDMDKAVERLHLALVNSEQIAIYGDYDADGVTATALVYEFLTLCGAKPIPYIPNRFDEGYGLNIEAIDSLAAQDVKLIITVDCGVRSVREIQHARDLGIGMIITDHHLPGDEPLPADAIINPKQLGDLYPDKMLAGVGLAYKFVQGYLQKYPIDSLSADRWLDLVAIGTVADMAPLSNENRMLVSAGLKQIRSASRQGLFSMAQACGLNLQKTNAGNIGFTLGPRLNAAGRIDSALAAFELLTTQDYMKAGQLAQKLEVQNEHRQVMTQEIQTQAIDMAMSRDPSAPIIFAARAEFNEGVVGLAASRIVETFYRPAVIGHMDETNTVASCRSINEFNITAALDQCADLLLRYGGHSAAAGFSVSNHNWPILQERLLQIARETFEGMELIPELFIDREILLENLDAKYVPGILDDLALLEPTGRGNPDALFCSRKLAVKTARTVGADGAHLKLVLRAGKREYEAIAFRQGYWIKDMPKTVDIAYTFEINEYMGNRTLQLKVRDLKPSPEG